MTTDTTNSEVHAMKTTEEELQALEARRGQITARLRKLRQEVADGERELIALEGERHRVRLRGQIGVPGGVRLRFHAPAGHNMSHLNDSKGTLLEVRRTRATVDFGDERPWIVLIDSLALASEPQGLTIALTG